MSVNEELHSYMQHLMHLWHMLSKRTTFYLGWLLLIHKMEAILGDQVDEVPTVVIDSTYDLMDMNEATIDQSIRSNRVIEAVIFKDQFDVEVANCLPIDINQSIDVIHNKDPIDDEDFVRLLSKNQSIHKCTTHNRSKQPFRLK